MVKTGVVDFGRPVVTVPRGVVLHDLHAAPMAVHVAKAADVHQNVEAEFLPGAVGARDFIVTAAMPQPQVDDFAALRVRHALQRLRESADKNDASTGTGVWPPVRLPAAHRPADRPGAQARWQRPEKFGTRPRGSSRRRLAARRRWARHTSSAWSDVDVPQKQLAAPGRRASDDSR